MRNWKLPMIILVLLVLSMTFRTTTISSKTDDAKYSSNVTLVQKQDNWNGMVEAHSFYKDGRYYTSITKPPILPIASRVLTQIWIGLLGVSVLWLMFSVTKKKV